MVSALFFYFQSSGAVIEPGEVRNPEFLPIKGFVGECAQQIATDSVRLIGAQGGFAEVPGFVKLDPQAFVPMEESNTFVIPLWWFDGQDRTPAIEYMQRDIKRDIEENIDDCLNDFEAFEDQFVIKKLGPPIAEVLLTEKDVQINLEYQFEVLVKGTGKRAIIKEHSTNVPVKLKRIYELATAISQKQQDQLFLENITIDLMSLNPEIPFSGLTFHCGRLMWSVGDVKKQTQSLILDAIQRVRIKNTDHLPFLAEESIYKEFEMVMQDDYGNLINVPDKPRPADAYEYFHYYIDATPKDYSDLSATLLYRPEWEFYLNAKPSDNGLMFSGTSGKLTDYLRFMCVNTYHFVYDISFPVVVYISDPEAFNGRGFQFNFGLPVNIYNNEAIKRKVKLRPFSPPFQSPESTSSFCTSLSDSQVEIRARDEYSFKDLRDINISYDCIGYGCKLGATAPKEGTYKLKTGLPNNCFRGKIIAEGENYMKTEKQHTGEDYFEIKLVETKDVDFEIKKKVYNSQKKQLSDQSADIESVEFVILRMRNRKYPDYDVMSIYPLDTDTETLEDSMFFSVSEDFPTVNKITLLKKDTIYAVEMFLLRRNVREGETKIIGGFTGNWSVTRNQVTTSDKATFYVLEHSPWPREDMDQAMLMYNLEQFSLPIKHELS
ncbi:hypothetical protein ACFL0W_06150 [Nanoarchaeota archaeon]